MDEELYDEILWVLKNYGSDAQERKEPGSKIKAQTERIVRFVVQREEARALLHRHGLDLVRVVRFSY